MFKRVIGTKDILPEESSAWQLIEKRARNILCLYNYKEIRTPLVETAALFNRSLGQNAEIVQKQMFLIKNKEELYALRPEGTASIVRSYIENNLDKTSGFLKLYYIGPMFRLERPQKGRLRQFHHIGVEAIGSLEPELDIEIIALADTLLKNFGITGYKIKINSLGCPQDTIKLSEILRKELKSKLTKLCPDCRVRYKKNALRILDCKNENCKELVTKLPLHEECLCVGCKGHFNKVKRGLSDLKVAYEVNPHLVRGLDYYTRTVFEIIHPGLGSQDAIGAGGRYDNLVKELGGPELGAAGFAFGIERLLLASPQSDTAYENLTYIITLGETAKNEGIKLLQTLRENSIPSDTDYENKSLKAAMRKANDLKARNVIIVGDDELKNSTFTLKKMVDGTQKQLNLTELIKELKC
jgi:histidyl-tRNA synthetase